LIVSYLQGEPLEELQDPQSTSGQGIPPLHHLLEVSKVFYILLYTSGLTLSHIVKNDEANPLCFPASVLI
jgi:hypothetical protein